MTTARSIDPRRIALADTETAIGLEPLMAAATAIRQDWLADEAAAAPKLNEFSDKQWREVLDLLIERMTKVVGPAK